MFLKLVSVTFLGALLINTPVHANSLINNNVQAFVDGSIIQEASNHSNNEVNIGSIIVHGNASARNITSKVFVKQDIIVKSSKTDIKVNIGSVEIGR